MDGLLIVLLCNYAFGATPHLDSARDCLAIIEGEDPSLDGAPSLDGEKANSEAEVAVNGTIMAGSGTYYYGCTIGNRCP
ncbi:hypothetical protein AMTR_s00182p00018840 [Amborella trichopoda]|uniref:Uncharacterized protein n=1 Tax=Amborella trichopoda TaxID=13333 RepID=U5D4H2_AMBTC|nr:hypothetical protein AMTR_s00182p00018840 [Amborella trichopoda]